MRIFDIIKSKNIDELAEWLDKFKMWDDTPWTLWYNETYCKKCEPIVKDGMDYKDYLKILLFLEKKERLSMRCLDLVELNLKKVHGLSFFKVDLCVTEIQMKCRCSFRRGITYTFPVDFSYQ